MKKKVLGIVLLITVVFLCSACNGSVTRDIRHAGFSVSSKFTCNSFYPSGKGDVDYKKIRFYVGNHIIDQDGHIYEVSLSGVYANKQNCKRSDSNIVVKSIFDETIVKGNDDKYYYLSSQNTVASYSLVPTTDTSYELYDLLLKDKGVVKVVTADSSSGIYYVLRTDGTVYQYTVSKADYNSPLKIVTISIVYDKSDYGADIIDFNYAGNSVNTYIKTEDSVYRMKITNYDKCSKYVDVNCKYKIALDPIFEKYKDRIIGFNGSTLITDYNQTFTVTN